jgi:hypothetical protein
LNQVGFFNEVEISREEALEYAKTTMFSFERIFKLFGGLAWEAYEFEKHHCLHRNQNREKCIEDNDRISLQIEKFGKLKITRIEKTPHGSVSESIRLNLVEAKELHKKLSLHLSKQK